VPAAPGTAKAAAAKAAHDVLVHRFPAQEAALDLIYTNYLIDHQISILDAGRFAGAAAAQCMNELRTGDGSFPATFPPFFGFDQVYIWRSPVAMATPWLANVTPYTLRSPDQFRAKAPPKLTSPEYTRDFNEVKSLGGLGANDRTPAQTELANFWNLNYPQVWERALRDISVNVGNVSDTSRMFVMATMAGADAVITSWDSKIAYVSWRPSMGIRDAHLDGNPNTERDENWTPMVGANPPYPDHTSGANNISAATTRALSLFFGTDEITFDVNTTNTGPTINDTRTFHKFSDVRDEVIAARILEGIHFRFADEAGRKQGEHVAQWMNGHFFHPRDDASAAASK